MHPRVHASIHHPRPWQHARSSSAPSTMQSHTVGGELRAQNVQQRQSKAPRRAGEFRRSEREPSACHQAPLNRPSRSPTQSHTYSLPARGLLGPQRGPSWAPRSLAVHRLGPP
eukprot:CAMPEP_0171252198 /NCGR_PEP_ID=MMETSP0790-20130122/51041_1 /TAXON_ID=2925 /ORGANISM="Alexandrium catenella, Strain OF101" /LENGTH=112 /DNA_ID=CAMNT_0011719939 /DNA_START=16 /DNA_END=351 /DNA_ORIENTATION=+